MNAMHVDIFTTRRKAIPITACQRVLHLKSYRLTGYVRCAAWAKTALIKWVKHWCVNSKPMCETVKNVQGFFCNL
jgi:hypothetical protein